MKLNLKLLLTFATLVFVFSCDNPNRNSEYKESPSSNNSLKSSANSPSEKPEGGTYSVSESNANTTKTSDTIINGFISSTAAIENSKDTSHRFIRTADMKFRVKNVFNSTITIEDIARRFHGFVTTTNLTSTINNTTVTAVSTDSSLESTYYTVDNTVTLRVPNTKLDSALRAIAVNIDYLDYRRIAAEDVALQLLANKLTQQRVSVHRKRLTKDMSHPSNGATISIADATSTTDAEESLMDKQEIADNAKLNNLSLMDRIKYSTINLDIYQRPTVKRLLIANDKNIQAYQPSYGSQLLEALKMGWGILEDMTIGLMKIWPLLLLVAAAFAVYFKWFREKPKR